MTNKLEILKRKHIGKLKIKQYKDLFSNLMPLRWFDIEDTDLILKKIKSYHYYIECNELIERKCIKSFAYSKILYEVFENTTESSNCYIFTDDYEYCGLFLVNTKKALECSLSIAHKDIGNTCFILDEDYRFYIVINYYDETHNDFPDYFEVQRKLNLDKYYI